jgi:ABC-type Zn uptake system ZnuABC Zn-binding protein ZnuA
MLAAFAGLGLALTACAPTAGSSRGTANDGVIDVVASTSVYGDIVTSIGGDKVRVSSIINRTSQDPHSYEVSTQDKLVVSKAELVVENGGGYDTFIDTLATETGLDHGNVINAVDASGLTTESPAAATPDSSGHTHEHAGLNEHVWYSLPAMSRLAEAVADKLGSLEPASAETFRANAAAFKASLGRLETRLGAIKSSEGHVPVAVTEPVPLYLLEDAGLENETPAEYMAAIEEDADVPPAVLKATVGLVSSRGVRLLAYNTQTEGPQTAVLKKAAETAGVPVVDFSETLPAGQSYVQWMSANVESISKALG